MEYLFKFFCNNINPDYDNLSVKIAEKFLSIEKFNSQILKLTKQILFLKFVPKLFPDQPEDF